MNHPVATPTGLACGIPVSAEQQQIVEHLLAHPVTVVSAGAGAGKTYTTVAAIVELLATGAAQADEFVLITFTNQAADELRKRLQSEIVGQQQRQPARAAFWAEQRERLSASFIGTIHAFCKQVLGLHGYAQGVSREASVSFARRIQEAAIRAEVEALLSNAGDTVAKLVLERNWPEHELRKRLNKIFEQARSQGLAASRLRDATRAQPEDAGKAYRVRIAELVAGIETRYEADCAAAQSLDAAALLTKTAGVLASADGDWVAVRLGERFKYLFIDEFQDTNPTQAQIASCLAPRLKTFVVGDRKQAIYRFTGAQVRLLDQFAKRHHTAPLQLRQSGRPTKQLLELQNALFASMKHAFPALDEPLQASDRNPTPNDGLPPMVVLTAPDDGDDADKRLALRIQRVLGLRIDRRSEEGPAQLEPGDIVVLTRTNDEVDHWVATLNAANIPARSDNGTPFLRRDEVVAMYRYLLALSRYPDEIALIEALTTPEFEEVDLRAEEARLISFGKQRGHPLLHAFETGHPQAVERLMAMRRASRIDTVPQLIGRIEQTYALKQRYRAAGQEDAALSLDRLRDYARSRFASDQALTLATFLDMMRRDMLADPDLTAPASSAEQRPEHVRVMTIHAAKGLEFPVVVVPGLESNRRSSRLPDFLVDPEHGLEVDLPAGVETTSAAFRTRWSNEQSARLAEEMRLFYVAVTRAQRMLLLAGKTLSVRPRGAHTWQDEVERAKAVLRQRGALFGSL